MNNNGFIGFREGVRPIPIDTDMPRRQVFDGTPDDVVTPPTPDLQGFAVIPPVEFVLGGRARFEDGRGREDERGRLDRVPTPRLQLLDSSPRSVIFTP